MVAGEAMVVHQVVAVPTGLRHCNHIGVDELEFIVWMILVTVPLADHDQVPTVGGNYSLLTCSSQREIGPEEVIWVGDVYAEKGTLRLPVELI